MSLRTAVSLKNLILPLMKILISGTGTEFLARWVGGNELNASGCPTSGVSSAVHPRSSFPDYVTTLADPYYTLDGTDITETTI